MHHFDYQIGPWKAHASVHQVDDSKLMATIRVLDNDQDDAISSQHTVVFDHDQALDAMEETGLILKNLLSARYKA